MSAPRLTPDQARALRLAAVELANAAHLAETDPHLFDRIGWRLLCRHEWHYAIACGAPDAEVEHFWRRVVEAHEIELAEAVEAGRAVIDFAEAA